MVLQRLLQIQTFFAKLALANKVSPVHACYIRIMPAGIEAQAYPELTPSLHRLPMLHE